MNKETEKNLLNTLYDRLHQAVTYSPEGNQGGSFKDENTFIQFAQNQALRPEDFANLVTPTNPEGNLGASETFAAFVDKMPSQTSSYSPSSALISDTYKQIVNGANSTTKPNPVQQKKYQQAYDYLNTKSSIKDHTGQEVEQIDNSPIYKKYLENQTSYLNSISGYRTAYLGYTLTDPEQQRQWQAKAPILQNLVNRSYNTWRSQGANQVEGALSAIASSINDAVGNIIREAQQTMSLSMASSTGSGNNWYFSYPIPSNFADPDASGFTTLSFNSDQIEENSTKKATDWSAGGSAGWGLWKVGASASGHHSESTYHMDANIFNLKADIAVVRIMRPWLNDMLFKVDSWYTNAVGRHGVSTGQLTSDRLLMPLIPQGFIVARNVEITANWSAQDIKRVEDTISTKGSVGWGPFSVSGSYSNSTSSEYHKSKFDGGTLKIPGIQVIAWISEITPACPPESEPSSMPDENIS